MIRKNDNGLNIIGYQLIAKNKNKMKVYRLIAEHSFISRARLASITGLSPTTISSLVDELIKGGMVSDNGEYKEQTVGRNPKLLSIIPNGKYVIAIEFLKYSIITDFYDMNCNSIYRCESKYIDSSTSNIINESIKSGISIKKLNIDKCIGIVMGIPALVDYSTGEIILSTVLPENIEKDCYMKIVNSYPNIPVVMGNESWFSAYAHLAFGEYEVNNLVFIDVGVGIGAGIIMNGKIFTGANGVVGEIGHMSIELDGPICRCGNKGCLEALAGLENFKKRINSAFNKELSFQEFNIELNNSNPIAKDLIEEEAQYLAIGINNIINILSPDLVILGGKISDLNNDILIPINNKLKDLNKLQNVKVAEVVISNLGIDKTLKGAAKYMLDEMKLI